MLPRRSLRLRRRQLNGQIASQSAASLSSTSTDETSKSMAKTAEKRARIESSSGVDGGNQPKQKRIKLIKNNLESFPAEILEKIFIKTTDVGLLNLANTCTRFEAIAQTVFSQRYTDTFFSINHEWIGGDPEIYAALFNCFGNHIKAIQLNHINEIDSTIHWASKIVQSHTNRIEKLTYNECSFKSNDVLSQPLVNATHLVFRDVRVSSPEQFDLPDCRNLVELEIRGTRGHTMQSLQRTIHNNPALQRIILKDFYRWNDYRPSYDSEINHFSIIDSIANHLTDVKELVLFDENYLVGRDEPFPASRVDKIVNSFNHLESLSIDVDDINMLALSQRLANECKNLKHLGLFYYNGEVYGDGFRSFLQIESLHYCYDDFLTVIGLPVGQFPNLRHLTIEVYAYYPDVFSNLLLLLHKCRSLRRITMIIEYFVHPRDFITAAFFEKFIETTIVTGKQNIQIEVAGNIGSITANGVVWRNKLMHWTGCGENHTNIHLLDLADHHAESDTAKKAANQTNLLDKIFDYLDLRSLAALVEINQRSKQLVNSYVKKHAKKQKTFFINDEFYVENFYSSIISNVFDKLDSARFITDLSVRFLNSEPDYKYCNHLIQNSKCLNKLSIYYNNSYVLWSRSEESTAQALLAHIIHNSLYSVTFCDLNRITMEFPQTETIECKNAGLFNDLTSVYKDPLKFRKLKKFMFNYRGKTQMRNLKKIFANTTVQLVPISQNLPEQSKEKSVHKR